ncbi:MAG TPA: hypothetical protein VIH99_09800 [Bdellovibrionota bacterium]
MFKASILTTAGLFVAISASAMPNVGDQAVYDVTSTQGGQSTKFAYVMEIVSYDAAANKFLQQNKYQIPGQPERVETEWKDASEYVSDATVDDVLANCRDYGGTPQTIKVPAGTFPTCKLPVSDQKRLQIAGSMWVAKVSFGIARSDTTENGQHTLVELRSFHVLP